MAADEHQHDHEPDLGELDLLGPLVHHARRRVLRDLLLLDSCGDNFISRYSAFQTLSFVYISPEWFSV